MTCHDSQEYKQAAHQHHRPGKECDADRIIMLQILDLTRPMAISGSSPATASAYPTSSSQVRYYYYNVGGTKLQFWSLSFNEVIIFFLQREIVGTSTSLKGSKLSLTKKSSQYFLWRVCNHHGSLAGLGVLHLASLLSSRLNLSISHQGALMMLIMVIMMIMVIFAMLTI